MSIRTLPPHAQFTIQQDVAELFRLFKKPTLEHLVGGGYSAEQIGEMMDIGWIAREGTELAFSPGAEITALMEQEAA